MDLILPPLISHLRDGDLLVHKDSLLDARTDVLMTASRSDVRSVDKMQTLPDVRTGIQRCAVQGAPSCLSVGLLRDVPATDSVYLMNDFAQTIVRDATLRQKLQLKLSLSLSYCILTPGRPVLALTLNGRQLTG